MIDIAVVYNWLGQASVLWLALHVFVKKYALTKLPSAWQAYYGIGLFLLVAIIVALPLGGMSLSAVMQGVFAVPSVLTVSLILLVVLIYTPVCRCLSTAFYQNTQAWIYIFVMNVLILMASSGVLPFYHYHGNVALTVISFALVIGLFLALGRLHRHWVIVAWAVALGAWLGVQNTNNVLNTVADIWLLVFSFGVIVKSIVKQIFNQKNCTRLFFHVQQTANDDNKEKVTSCDILSN